MFNNLSSEILTVYEAMSKNIVDLDRPQMTVLRRISFRAGYPILQTIPQNSAFPRELWFIERSLIFTYIACLLFLCLYMINNTFFLLSLLLLIIL